MKIIKPGKKAWKYENEYRLTCPICGCEFICNESEIAKPSMHIVGIIDEVYVKCPYCHIGFKSSIDDHVYSEGDEESDK